MDEKSVIIAAVITVVEKLGYVPSVREYKKLKDVPSWKKIKRLFGGWNDMLREADLPIKREMPRLDDGKVLDAILDFANKHDRVPTFADFREHLVGVDSETVIAHFGSLTNALDALGLECEYGQGTNFEQIEENLRELAHKLGRTPTREEFEEAYDFTVYREHLTWTEIVKQAGLKPTRNCSRRKPDRVPRRHNPR
jgi:hypothetical protein